MTDPIQSEPTRLQYELGRFLLHGTWLFKAVRSNPNILTDITHEAVQLAKLHPAYERARDVLFRALETEIRK